MSVQSGEKDMKNGFLLLLTLSASFLTTPVFAAKISELIPKAIESGEVDEVRKVLENFDAVERKKYINLADRNGYTPLHRAVIDHTVEMVKLLLTNGAKESINKVDIEGRTPLYWAVQNKDLAMVKLLLYFDAKITKDILELIDPSDKSTIALLIKKPIYLESQLTKEEKEEFAKLRGDRKIDPFFNTGFGDEYQETRVIEIYK